MNELRIAMWSGPRNISTAMMRSFENRADTYVCDEPLYAHYLARTGKDHPGRDEILKRHETDWRRVVAQLTGPIPNGRAIFYQKHMAHHLLAGVDRGWLDALTHAFLIRDPEEMLTSLIKNVPNPTVDETGLPQQVEIFRRIRRASGAVPPVLDARDVLDDPPRHLAALCERLRVPFDAAMLSWRAGPRDTDGVWAPHWYDAVYRTTGFEPFRPKDERVPDRLRSVLDACRPIYDELYQHRIH